MNTIAMTAVGSIAAPPAPYPIKTNLFFNYNGAIRDSWSFFARNSGDDYKNKCVSGIMAGGGNSIIALLSNGDSTAPVSFFSDCWGGTVDMAQLGILENNARMFAQVGGGFWPCFFCDGDESAAIRNASNAVHDRAIGLLIAHLRPYVPGFCIGLESSEYWDCERHNYFAALIRHYAPDRYVVSHMQRVPDGGMPNIDGWFYEHSWSPHDGDNHTPEEVVAEVQTASKYGKVVCPVEHSTQINGTMIRKQCKALVAAGFGYGGCV